MQVWDAQTDEKFRFSFRMLQWQTADRWLRPLSTLDLGIGQTYPKNYIYNTSACTYVGCGQLSVLKAYSATEQDILAVYTGGIGAPGRLPVPTSGHLTWTVQQDNGGGGGGVVTVLAQGNSEPNHLDLNIGVRDCPFGGCWPPPPPPPVVPEESFGLWSDPKTWNDTLTSLANPHNSIDAVKGLDGSITYKLSVGQNWAGALPGPGDNVWIPAWKKVVLTNLSLPPSIPLFRLFLCQGRLHGS
jgi:hypothetical protein